MPESINVTIQQQDAIQITLEQPSFTLAQAMTHFYTKAEVDAIFDSVDISVFYTKTEVDAFLALKSDVGHTHDDRYYTEAEIITLLSGKSNTGHTHDDRYYTETEIDTNIYTKTQVDTLLTSYYTKTETDVILQSLADAFFAFVNAETDSLLAAIVQYSDEKVDDRVAVLIQNGTGISWVYSDVGNTLTPTISLASFTTANLADSSNKRYVTDAQLTVIGNTSGTNTGDEAAASTTLAGKVELATAAETTTGTDATRATSPDSLAHSDYGKRIVEIQVTDPSGAALTTGDGKAYFVVPSTLNGYNLVTVNAFVITVSSSGLPTFQIANVTDTVDILSTKVSIDANENTSHTAATPPVIDTTKDDVATGDILRIDCDVAGTGAKGAGIILTFQLP